MKHIAEITVTPKKGETIVTRWHVRQDRPYPNIHGHSASGLDWQNLETLNPSYSERERGVKPALPATYRAALLRSDFDPATATGDRRDHAGYDTSPSYRYENGERVTVPPALNPGTIVYRGRDLGEISLHLTHWDVIKVNGYDEPSPGECKFLEEQVAAPLRAYIAANAASLHAEAKEAVKARFASELDAARARLAVWEKQAAEIVAIA